MTRLNSLAGRLGMRRPAPAAVLPSGLEAESAAREAEAAAARAPIEAAEREFYLALNTGSRMPVRELDRVRPPYGPDPLVFGPPGAPPQGGGRSGAVRWCGCGCGQAGAGPCWKCGRPG